MNALVFVKYKSIGNIVRTEKQITSKQIDRIISKLLSKSGSKNIVVPEPRFESYHRLHVDFRTNYLFDAPIQYCSNEFIMCVLNN